MRDVSNDLRVHTYMHAHARGEYIHVLLTPSGDFNLRTERLPKIVLISLTCIAEVQRFKYRFSRLFEVFFVCVFAVFLKL